MVYEVTDVAAGGVFALKRLHAQFHDETLLSAVQRDAVAAGALGDATVLAPLGSGFDDDGCFYLVTERFAGEALQDRISRGPLPIDEVQPIFQALCQALDTAHGRGLCHGDLTPRNVLCAGAAAAVEVRVTDFGMHQLGAGGLWYGAAGYLPPESYRGQPAASPRGDVFALGALLYECLTGRPLFSGTSAGAVMFKVCLQPLPVLSTVIGEAPAGRLEAVLSMACAKEPAARFESAGAFRRALEAALAPGGASVPEAPMVVPDEPVAAQAATNPMPAEELPRPSPRRLGLFAGLGGLAMAGLLLLGLNLRERLRPADARGITPRASAVAAFASAQPSASTQSAAAQLLAAEESFVRGDYVGALGQAEALLARAPRDPAALELQRRAAEALRLSGVYQSFARAVGSGDLDTALALYRELPAGSPFRARAQSDGHLAPLRERFQRAHLQIAQAAERGRDCDEIGRQAGELRALPELAELTDHGAARSVVDEVERLLQRCRGQRLASARREPRLGEGAGRRGLKNPFASP